MSKVVAELSPPGVPDIAITLTLKFGQLNCKIDCAPTEGTNDAPSNIVLSLVLLVTCIPRRTRLCSKGLTALNN